MKLSIIYFDNVTFYYTDSKDKIFENLTLNIDTSWRLGLTGNNGRGKTTFLNLIRKTLEPVKGEVHPKTDTFYFPYVPNYIENNTLNVIKENIAPYIYWESRMKELTEAGDDISLAEYGNILEKYQTAQGYEINALIEKEFSEIGMNIDLLNRKFDSLSGGEQTRALIISLFLKNNSFPLIDEPTDHLDMKGRLILGDYLAGKKGFIVASHDRYFLDICTDHILSVNKSDIRINKGNYSQWKYNMEAEEEFEKRKNENLKREIKSLETAAKKRRKWSDLKEKEKTGATTIKPDKGYLSHKASKLMKRALHIESRIEDKLEEKKSLLKNLEDKRKLKIDVKSKSSVKLLSVNNATLKFGNTIIFENLSFDIYKGERVALLGNNGSGKTSLLKTVLKELTLTSGEIYHPNYISVSYSSQDPLWNKGLLRDFLKSDNIDETKFRNIMGVMGAWGELFERPLETFSMGQLKKIELCKSFLKPFDILIWDEPLNNLDIYSREQLEEVILEYKPTILFSEHDVKFIQNVATSTVSMNNE